MLRLIQRAFGGVEPPDLLNSSDIASSLRWIKKGEHSDGDIAGLSDDTVKFLELIDCERQNYCVTDPKLPDDPIIFASKGFYKLTGVQTSLETPTTRLLIALDFCRAKR